MLNATLADGVPSRLGGRSMLETTLAGMLETTLAGMLETTLAGDLFGTGPLGTSRRPPRSHPQASQRFPAPQEFKYVCRLKSISTWLSALDLGNDFSLNAYTYFRRAGPSPTRILIIAQAKIDFNMPFSIGPRQARPSLGPKGGAHTGP